MANTYIYNYQGFIPIYGNLFLRNIALNHGGGHLGVGARDTAGWSDVVAHGAPGGFGPATHVMPGAHLKTRVAAVVLDGAGNGRLGRIIGAMKPQIIYTDIDQDNLLSLSLSLSPNND